MDQGNLTMRSFIFPIALLSTLSVAAQQPIQPPAGSNWKHVQALPVGTDLYIKAKTRHASCKLKKDDDSTLTCTSYANDIVFDRTEISSIKISRNGRSALAGLGIGVGTGAIIGLTGCHGSWQGACTAVYGTILGGAGAILGFTTDFTRSTVYRAPKP
jgi:hypothetical protein